MGMFSCKLCPKSLSAIAAETDISKKDVRDWYKAFIKSHPQGKIKESDFVRKYVEFFPHPEAKSTAEEIFNRFDENDDGRMDFREFMCAIAVSSPCNTVDEKLELAFVVYDMDENDYITKDELEAVFLNIWKFGCHDRRITKLEVLERSQKAFNILDTNKDGKITRDEFITELKNDPLLMQFFWQPQE